MHCQINWLERPFRWLLKEDQSVAKLTSWIVKFVAQWTGDKDESVAHYWPVHISDQSVDREHAYSPRWVRDEVEAIWGASLTVALCHSYATRRRDLLMHFYFTCLSFHWARLLSLSISWWTRKNACSVSEAFARHTKKLLITTALREILLYSPLQMSSVVLIIKESIYILCFTMTCLNVRASLEGNAVQCTPLIRGPLS